MYEENEFLQLSGIQHFAFCRRQWALAYIEMQWQENVRTVEGRLLHEKAHDTTSREKRGDLLISRGMPIHSKTLGISGECDVVEFHREEDGITLQGYEGTYKVVPVEYKKGKPKQGNADILQLTAQAMCLEEMLCCAIPDGALYYGEPRRRTPVLFSQELRQQVCRFAEEMHQYSRRGHTPRAKPTQSCKACSLKDLCLPQLARREPVSSYLKHALEELP